MGLKEDEKDHKELRENGFVEGRGFSEEIEDGESLRKGVVNARMV